MSSLSKLTIIIPTYNRERYVLRNMGFWSGTDVTVHVLDGSAEAIKTNQLARFTSNIHYHHLPVFIWIRLAKVADLVDTEYVVLLSDDDFFIPSAVEASIFELEKNRALVACCGRGISKCLASDLIVNWSTIKSYKSNAEGGVSGAVVQDEPLERIVEHMNPYVLSIIYAVCRSQAWLKAIQLLSVRQFTSGLVSEMQFELYMSFHGKVKVIDELMTLRSDENTSSVVGFELEFRDWYMDKHYSNEVDVFLNTTAHDLEVVSELNFDAIRNGLELACSAYVAFCDKNHKQSRQSLSGKNTFSSINLPRVLKTYIKKFVSGLPAPLLTVLPERLRFRPYIEIAKQLESEGLYVDWDQLNTILERVRRFYTNK